MIEAVVRKANIRKAPSGFFEDAVTTEVEGHEELELTRHGRQNFQPAQFDADASSTGAVREGDYVYAGWPAQILKAPMHSGERARISVQLEDRQGRSVSAVKTIVIGARAVP